MSSFEAGFSTGQVSLSDLMRGRFEGCSRQSTTLAELVAHLSRGGWPGDLHLSDQACMTARIDYLEEIRRVDIARVDGVSRNPDNVARVLQSLARNVATPVSGRTIAADAGGGDGPLDGDTVRSYLAALRRLMVYEEQPAWSPRLRSRSLLRRCRNATSSIRRWRSRPSVQRRHGCWRTSTSWVYCSNPWCIGIFPFIPVCATRTSITTATTPTSKSTPWCRTVKETGAPSR